MSMEIGYAWKMRDGGVWFMCDEDPWEVLKDPESKDIVKLWGAPIGRKKDLQCVHGDLQ